MRAYRMNAADHCAIERKHLGACIADFNAEDNYDNESVDARDEEERHEPLDGGQEEDEHRADGRQEEHADQLEQLLALLERYSLKLKPSKMLIGTEALTIFGFRVEASGVQPDPERVHALVDVPPPTTPLE